MGFLERLFGQSDGNANAEEVIDLDLPFEHIIVKGKDAVEELNKLRSNVEITPVIMGDSKHLNLLIDNFGFSEQSTDDIYKSADEIQFPQWFESKSAQDEEYYQEPHGEWPAGDMPNMGLSSHLNVLTRMPLKQVVIGLLPVENTWEVPAFLKLGDWNECPRPEEHVAIFRKWAEEYSAKVACVTGDVIEFEVASPPVTKEQAIKLAKEQYVYCPDIVDQGVETIENLAASLLNGKTWYFWWD